MKSFDDLPLKPFSEAPDELISMMNEGVFYVFLPALYNVWFCESGDGYIVLSKTGHIWSVCVFGRIDTDDLYLDKRYNIFFKGEENRLLDDFTLMDFKIDWTKEQLKKYEQRNSTYRRVNQDKVTVDVYSHNDLTFNMDVEESEIDELLHIWEQSTKTSIKVQVQANKKMILLNQGDLDRIVYRCNGKLAGLQVFERLGNQVYFQVNISDYSLIGKSGFMWVFPIIHYNQPIHYEGAGPGDNRLIEHKNRICQGKNWTFDKLSYFPDSNKRDAMFNRICDMIEKHRVNL